MDDTVELPCLPPVPTIDVAPHGLPLPHDLVVGSNHTVVVPTERGVETIEIAVRNRCEMLASREYSGKEWRRIECGLGVIAFRIARPEPDTFSPSDSSAPTDLSESDPSA